MSFDFIQAATAAFDRQTLSVIIARVEATGPDHYGMHFHLPENAFLFRRWIQENEKRNAQ